MTARELVAGALQIGRYPVTVEEFRCFVEDEEGGYNKAACWAEGGYGGNAAPHNWDEQILHPNRPVTYVNWFEACAYCAWVSKRPVRIRLPKEEEWEFAARGKENRRYPWGNEPPDLNRANYSDADVGQVTPVGLFPAGNTPGEGIADLGGNVWEWTASASDKQLKVVRGASFGGDASGLRSAFRDWLLPGFWYKVAGFRCVRE